MKKPLETAYCVFSLDEHNDIKDTLLDEIQNTDSEEIIMNSNSYSFLEGSTERDVVSAGDFFVDSPTQYMDTLVDKTSFIQQANDEFHDLGYDDAKIFKWWFQQYRKNDTHSWHTHGKSNWAIVYYVELPEEAPPTLFLNLYNHEIIEPGVSEGDVIIFPANMPHTSPPNKSNERKTIIAMNVVCSNCHNDINTDRNS